MKGTTCVSLSQGCVARCNGGWGLGKGRPWVPRRLHSPWLLWALLSAHFASSWSTGIYSALAGSSLSALKLWYWTLLKENCLCPDRISGEKYWIASWTLCCMINFLKCCKYILIMLVAFKRVLQLNSQSFSIAFPYLKAIWINRISSFCQVADIVLTEPPLTLCFGLLLCWGWVLTTECCWHIF